MSIDDDPGHPRHDVGLATAAVVLLWIPLGAGASVVRLSGTLFESMAAQLQRRRRCDLYHSALEVTVPAGRFVIEMAPIPDLHGERRGVVGEGAVGRSWAGRFRVFRYENRCWPEGEIPDVDRAVSKICVSDDEATARRIIGLVPSVPTPVWGRDELGAGEMWSSNSVTSWVLSSGGVDMTWVHPPLQGRAPGWDAGLAIASRARHTSPAVTSTATRSSP